MIEETASEKHCADLNVSGSGIMRANLALSVSSMTRHAPPTGDFKAYS